MKDSFSSRQWWRLPPVIVISLIAAVALLFLSGRAAVMAFAEGEDDITISFHANGASGSPPASITVEKGETFTLPSDSGGMTKEGYSLVRWSVTPDGSTNTWSLGSQECFYEDTVLYALWEKNVTVTFDLNGGTGSAPEPLIIRPTDFGSYESFVMPGSTSDMAKEGFRFSHWDSEPDGSGDFYDPGTTYYNINQDLRLYAQWQQVVTVRFDANGGTGSVPEPQQDVGSVLISPIPEKPADLERPGYEFLYWSNTPDESGDAFYPDSYHTFYEDTVLYAVWGKDISVTYDPNGGTGTPPASVTGQPYLNVTIASADTLSKAGAEFIHWNTAADDSGTYYLPGWSESFGEDVVLYAIWKDTITVSYDLNGGTGTPPASVTGIPELYIKTPPEPERGLPLHELEHKPRRQRRRLRRGALLLFQ